MQGIWTKIKIPAFVLFTFAAYYLTAKLGLNLATINNQASPVWPATGVALSAMIIFGPTSLIGIFFAAFLVNLQTGLNISATTLIAFGNMLEAAVFYFAGRRLLESKETYGAHTIFIFGLGIIVLSTATSATVGTAALYFSSIVSKDNILVNWQTWWVGDLLGAFIITPMAYKIAYTKWDEISIKSSQIFKFSIVTIAAILISYFVFGSDFGKSYLFCIFIGIYLPALWFNSFWIYLTSLCICSYAVYQTSTGHGPFTSSFSVNESLIHLQIFVAALAITSMGLESIKTEKLFWRSSVVLIVGWILAGLTFHFSYKSSESEDELKLKSLITQAENEISNRINDYLQLIGGGAGFIGASEFVSDKEWHVYSERVLSTNRFPGITGIGLIVPEKSNSRYRAHLPIFDLKNADPKSEKNEKFVVTYIEPYLENQKALGLNISSEENRFQAIIYARDTGLPTMTKPITLIQDQFSRPGFHILLPVYKQGFPVQNTEQRKIALIGFIYTPIIYELFINSAIAKFENQINLKVVDGTTEAYASTDFKKFNAKETFTSIELAGHRINLYWKKGPKFVSSLSSVSLWIGFFGAVFSLLFALVLSSLQNISVRAESLASKMTKEVENQKKMWQTLSELSPIGIYLTDKNEKCTYANPTWRKIHDINESEVQNIDWTSLIHPDDFDKVLNKWKSKDVTGNFTCTYRVRKISGEIMYVSALSASIKDEDNNVTGYLGTILDVTELHQNQSALVNSVKMSALGQMAGGLAHEINNPLAILHGKISIIEQMFSNPKKLNAEVADRHIQDMFSTIDRIAKIIRGLSSIAKESDHEPFEICQIQTAFESSLILCNKRITEKGINLILPESYPDFMFLGRNEQISQVLISLLYNALDAVVDQPNPWIKLEVQVGKSVVIEVSNSGPPIPANIQSKIFDPFFTTKDIGKGMGLGLSVSKGIIERHKGRIYLDATKQYTTFTIELPAYIENANVA